MPFNEKYEERGDAIGTSAMMDGCSRVFHNLVVTPHDHLAACCGLTLEHIPEMKFGDLKRANIKDHFEDELNDFLKIWIHVDGPAKIMVKLFQEEVIDGLKGVHHICQACAIMHQHPKVREEIKKRYQEFVPEILSRFNLKVAMRSMEARSHKVLISNQQEA
jgi:hypothetical protein